MSISDEILDNIRKKNPESAWEEITLNGLEESRRALIVGEAGERWVGIDDHGEWVCVHPNLRRASHINSERSPSGLPLLPIPFKELLQLLSEAAPVRDTGLSVKESFPFEKIVLAVFLSRSTAYVSFAIDWLEDSDFPPASQELCQTLNAFTKEAWAKSLQTERHRVRRLLKGRIEG